MRWPVGAVFSVYDIFDSRGNGTSVGMRLPYEHGVYQWGEFNEHGVQTGDNSGPFPDGVLHEPMWSAPATQPTPPSCSTSNGRRRRDPDLPAAG